MTAKCPCDQNKERSGRDRNGHRRPSGLRDKLLDDMSKDIQVAAIIVQTRNTTAFRTTSRCEDTVVSEKLDLNDGVAHTVPVSLELQDRECLSSRTETACDKNAARTDRLRMTVGNVPTRPNRKPYEGVLPP